MSKSSLATVGLGALTISTTSAFATGCYTTFKGTPQAGIIVSAAAINSGVTGLTFFSVREFAVSPILNRVAPWAQYAERRRELGIEPSSDDTITPPPPVLPSLRTNNLLDSGISGAITGGLLRGIRSGRPAVVPGTMTGAAICTVLQYSYNELNLVRLRYIARLKEEDRVMAPAFTPQVGTPAQSPEPSASYKEIFFKMIGLVPVSDEEYIAKLKRTRQVYLNRIAELEIVVEEENLFKNIPKS